MSAIKLLTIVNGNVSDVELSLSQSKTIFDPVTAIDTEIGGVASVDLGIGSSADVFGVLAGIELDNTAHVRHFLGNDPAGAQTAGRLDLATAASANDTVVNFTNIDDSLVPANTVNYAEQSITVTQLFVGVKSFVIPIQSGYARILINGTTTVNFDTLANAAYGTTETKAVPGYGEIVATKGNTTISCVFTLTEAVTETFTEITGDLMRPKAQDGNNWGSSYHPFPQNITAGTDLYFPQPVTPGIKFLISITIDRGFGDENHTYELTIINGQGYYNTAVHNGYLFKVNGFGYPYILRSAVGFVLKDASYRAVMNVPTGQTSSYPTITSIVSPEMNVSIPIEGFTATPIIKLSSGGFLGFFKTVETITINSMPANATTYSHSSATANCARSADGKSSVLGYDGSVITFESPPQPANFPIQIEIVRVEVKRALSIIGASVTLSSALKYAYATTDHVTSFIQLGALNELVTSVVNMTSVSNAVAPAAAYNIIQHEITTTSGTIEGQYSLVFTTQTAYEFRHNLLGVLGTGNINTDNPIINQDTGTPYLNIPIAGFGGGWVAGNVIRITVEGGKKKIKAMRRIDQTVDAIYNTTFSIAIIGSVKI